MASTIRIKRSGVAGNPSVLAQGELAYSYFNGLGGDRLYVGTGTETDGDAANHQVIGGSHYVSLLGGEGDAPYGTATPNTALILDSDGKVDQLKVARLTGLLAPVDGTDAVTKSYLEQILGDADLSASFTFSADSGSGDLFLSSETFTLAGGANITSVADSDTNSITFGLDTDVTGLTNVEVGNLKLEGNTLSSTDASETLYIDPAPTDSDAGTLIVRGDLIVQGVTTTINSTEMTVTDLTLTLADEATTPAEADGAGIFINGAGVSIVYDAAKDQINIDKGLNVNAPLSIDDVEIGEYVQDQVASLLTAGEGIDLTYTDETNELLIAAELATTTNVGVASFVASQFTVTGGEVEVYALDGGTY